MQRIVQPHSTSITDGNEEAIRYTARIGNTLQEVYRQYGANQVVQSGANETAKHLAQETAKSMTVSTSESVAFHLAKDGGEEFILHGRIEVTKKLAMDVGAKSTELCKSSLESAVKNCPKCNQNAAALSNLGTALTYTLVTEGFLWAYSVGLTTYKWHSGQISSQQCREKIIRRTTEGLGAAAFTVAGGYLGTLICPGTGTTIGMLGGRLLGAYLGTKVGHDINALVEAAQAAGREIEEQ